MAQRREIQFTIDADGNVSLQVLGVKGADCEKLTREMEEALGLVQSRERTSEFWQTTDVTQKLESGE